MRLGIYGGSFDPIHYGHLLLAECCREQRELDQVCFVPAFQSPHKLDTEPVPAGTRCEMVELAIGGHAHFTLSSIEAERGGVSYMIDTLRALGAEHEHSELLLLMGADTLLDFPKWKSPDEICKMCSLVVVERPGVDKVSFEGLRGIASPERILQFEALIVRMPQIDISSSEIRERVHSKRSIRFQTPRAVEEYIRANQLYV